MRWILLLASCTPIGDAPFRARAAADAFLLGDATAADTLLADGDTSVLEDLHERDLTDTTAARYLAGLALDAGVDTSSLAHTVEVCDGYPEDDPGRFEVAEQLVTTIAAASIATGTPPNCRMPEADDECGANMLTDSVFMGYTTEAADLADYVENLLLVDHPSATALALLGAPTARVYRFGWVGNADGPYNYNVYVCLPWQLTWHEYALRMSHEG